MKTKKKIARLEQHKNKKNEIKLKNKKYLVRAQYASTHCFVDRFNLNEVIN